MKSFFKSILEFFRKDDALFASCIIAFVVCFVIICVVSCKSFENNHVAVVDKSVTVCEEVDFVN